MIVKAEVYLRVENCWGQASNDETTYYLKEGDFGRGFVKIEDLARILFPRQDENANPR